MKNGCGRELPEELQKTLLENARPLSKREYDALRVNIGCLNAARHMCEGLEARLKECVPDGWREARMLESRWQKLFDKILLTIPREKLILLKSELPRYELYIRLNGAARYDADENDNVVLPRKTVMALANYATEISCPVCDRKGKGITKCRLRKTLCDVLPFYVETDGQSCPFSEYGIRDGGGSRA